METTLYLMKIDGKFMTYLNDYGNTVLYSWEDEDEARCNAIIAEEKFDNVEIVKMECKMRNF